MHHTAPHALHQQQNRDHLHHKQHRWIPTDLLVSLIIITLLTYSQNIWRFILLFGICISTSQLWPSPCFRPDYNREDSNLKSILKSHRHSVPVASTKLSSRRVSHMINSWFLLDSASRSFYPLSALSCLQNTNRLPLLQVSFNEEVEMCILPSLQRTRKGKVWGKKRRVLSSDSSSESEFISFLEFRYVLVRVILVKISFINSC